MSVALQRHGPRGGNSLIRENKLFLRECARILNENLNSVHRKVEDCLSVGGQVGFYGATNGLNVFLDKTELGSHERINVYDGDASKLGKFLTAAAKPIKSSSDQSYKDSNLIVVSAMSFSSEIKQWIIKNGSHKEKNVIGLCRPK